MHSREDKDRIMRNLKARKGNEQFKRISITDDYTIKDRNTIKEWIEKARKANGDELDPPCEWIVRGTRFRRNSPAEVPQTESQCLKLIQNINRMY